MAELVALWGDDHPALGEVAEAKLDDHAAVALSSGRFPKSTETVDPNEDAALAAWGPSGWLLAVADGHFGFDAARAALGAVARQVERVVDDPSESPGAVLEDACAAAIGAVAEAVIAAPPPRGDSRTALTLARVVEGYLYVVTYGDTACVRERGGRSKVIGRSGPFLGPRSDIHPVARVRLRADDRLLVASDGLTNYLGRDWAGRAAQVLTDSGNPLGAARELVEMAMDGGAGDHIAVCVLL